MKNANWKLLFRLSFSLVGLWLTATTSSQAQINIDTSYTAEQLVKQILVGNGVLVGPVQYQGPKHAMAYFEDPDFNVHLEKGIVLSSGNAYFVQGPNRVPDKGWASMTPGDEDLNGITTGETHDAAVLEFDFVTSSEFLSFNFVFGSEEYLEYVGSKYNDVFGFFISGPGLDNVNLAVLPGTEVPITVNNINHKKNKKYYHDNSFQNTSHPFIWDNRKKKPVRNKRYGKTAKAPPYQVQYDGFTQVLEARCQVVPNQVYHIKLAIADVSDYILDSGVFLEGGSFRSFGEQIVVMDNPFQDLQNEILELPKPRKKRRVHYKLKPKKIRLAHLDSPELPEMLTGINRELFNIEFAFDSYQIPKDYQGRLEMIFGLVEENPHTSIKIIGHTDNIGSEDYNIQLSAKRSDAVARYLQSKGVAQYRIKTLHFGEAQPIFANSTETGRTRNRRVEFVVEWIPEMNTANYPKKSVVEN